MANPIGILAGCAGKGLFAGAAGTAAMTASNTVEVQITGRGPSKTPALAICKALDIELKEEQQKLTFANVVHWQLRHGLGQCPRPHRLRRPEGVSGHGGLSDSGVGTELVMLPAMGVAKPAWTWSLKEIAIDALHHVVYAVVTSLAFNWIER